MIVILSYIVLCLIQYIFDGIKDMTFEKFKSSAFKFAKKYIPAVKNQIQKEMNKLKESFHKKFSEARKETSIACLPDTGISE